VLGNKLEKFSCAHAPHARRRPYNISRGLHDGGGGGGGWPGARGSAVLCLANNQFAI